jgi:hypothetical protein
MPRGMTERAFRLAEAEALRDFGSEASSAIEDGGSLVGRDPRRMTAEEVRRLGHERRPILQVIRAKCLDCCGGSEGEVRKCRAVFCDLWPYRMAANPFNKQNLDEETRKARGDRLRAIRGGRLAPSE